MDIQSRILEIVLDLQSDVSGLKTGMMNLQSEHNRMLSLLLDTRSDVQQLNGRMNRVEDSVEKTYRIMDAFLLESRKDRTEITANCSRCDQLDQRMTALEESRA